MALLKSESLNFADSRLLSSTADSTDGHRLGLVESCGKKMLR
jgi:hypothetical protein